MKCYFYCISVFMVISVICCVPISDQRTFESNISCIDKEMRNKDYSMALVVFHRNEVIDLATTRFGNTTG